jgi:hypothetical protein
LAQSATERRSLSVQQAAEPQERANIARICRIESLLLRSIFAGRLQYMHLNPVRKRLSVAAVCDRRSALIERRYNLRGFVHHDFSLGQSYRSGMPHPN